MDDATRFRALFEATFAGVQRYVRNRGVTGGRADDIVAETFVVAWRRLADVPTERPLPWLFAVARNLWLNQRRGDRRYEALKARLPLPPPAPPPTEPADLAPIHAALAALDPADREVICLVAWDELTATEVGAALGCGCRFTRGGRGYPRRPASTLAPSPPRHDCVAPARGPASSHRPPRPSPCGRRRG